MVDISPYFSNLVMFGSLQTHLWSLVISSSKNKHLRFPSDDMCFFLRNQLGMDQT